MTSTADEERVQEEKEQLGGDDEEERDTVGEKERMRTSDIGRCPSGSPATIG